MSTARTSRVIFFFEGTSKKFIIFPALHFERVVKQPSTCPRVYFWKKRFFGEKFSFWKYFDFDQKILVFLAKTFQQSFQKCILRVQLKFRGESFRKFTVFHFFLFMGRKIWTFDENFSTVRRNCILPVHGNNLKKTMWVNRIIMFFGVSVKNFPRGSAEYHSTCSQTFFELLIIFFIKILYF